MYCRCLYMVKLVNKILDKLKGRLDYRGIMHRKITTRCCNLTHYVGAGKTKDYKESGLRITYLQSQRSDGWTT